MLAFREHNQNHENIGEFFEDFIHVQRTLKNGFSILVISKLNVINVFKMIASKLLDASRLSTLSNSKHKYKRTFFRLYQFAEYYRFPFYTLMS